MIFEKFFVNNTEISFARVILFSPKKIFKLRFVLMSEKLPNILNLEKEKKNMLSYFPTDVQKIRWSSRCGQWKVCKKIFNEMPDKYGDQFFVFRKKIFILLVWCKATAEGKERGGLWFSKLSNETTLFPVHSVHFLCNFFFFFLFKNSSISC